MICKPAHCVKCTFLVCIQSKYRKIRTRKTLNMNTFHTVAGLLKLNSQEISRHSKEVLTQPALTCSKLKIGNTLEQSVKYEALNYFHIMLHLRYLTAQKMKFSIKDFFSKCDQIRSFLWIWLHLLKKSLMENFIFCAVST